LRITEVRLKNEAKSRKLYKARKPSFFLAFLDIYSYNTFLNFFEEDM